MWKLIILASLLFVTPASAVEVTGIGVGVNEHAALADAKQNALEQVTGTFVVSQTRATNDDVKKDTAKYSGGVIRKYEVVDTYPTGSMVTVVIRADVDPKKNNNIIVTESNISEEARQELIEQQQRAENIAKFNSKLENRQNAFAVIPGKISYTNRGSVTDVSITVGVRLSPKWIDDVRTFSREAGKPIDTSTPISEVLWGIGTMLAPANVLGSSLVRTAAHASQRKQPIEAQSNCFGVDNQHDVEECYAVGAMLGGVVRNDRFNVVARMWSGDELITELPVPVANNNRLFVLYDVGTSLYFRSSAKERKFNSRGILWFVNGIAASSYMHQVPTNLLVRVDRVDFELR